MSEQREPRQLVAFAIEFCREAPVVKRGGVISKRADWEQGLFVGRFESDDSGVIVDMEGKVVKPPIWNYRDQFYRGTLVLKEER